MAGGDVIPPIDLNTAIVEAVDLILAQFGISPLQILLGLFSGGRPKDEDTNNVIWAYHMSAYWPLQALGSDLAEMLKNGAPISDSGPAIQAQFGALKQGTVLSIQNLAQGQSGPGVPGYWTIFHLIEQSWSASSQGQQAVLQYVRALDTLTQVLAQQPKPPPQPPPGGGGTGGGGTAGGGGTGVGLDPNNDELLDVGNTLIAELNTVIGLLQNPTGGGGNDQCCTNVVNAISLVVIQLTQIARTLSSPTTPPVPPDLSGIVTALGELAAAVNAYPPALAACCAAVNTSLGNIATAIASNPPPDLTGIAKSLATMAEQGDVPQSVIDYLVQQGFVDSATAQVISGAPWAQTLVGFFRTAGWNALQWALKFCGLTINGGVLTLQPHDSTIARYLEDFIRDSLAVGAAPLYPVIKGLLDSVVALLTPAGVPTIGDVGVDENVLIAQTISPSLILRGVLFILGFFNIGGGEVMEGYVDLFSELTGLQEIRELQVGQRMRWGPMREAELRAKGTYRQEIAGLGTMASWVARGLYDNARYQGLAPLTGAPPEQVDPTLNAAYSGLGARRILPLIQTGLFSAADIADELRFSGLRPASLQRYLAAAPYLSTATERNALRSSIEKAYINGLLSDRELTARIDSAEQNTDRDALILERVRTEKLVVGVKDLEAEYTTMYLGGLIDDPTFRSYLSGIGLQPDMVNFIAGKAEARANATLRRKELAAAAALQRATASVERKAALQNFLDGNLPLPLYLAAIEATGLTPVQAAAWADLAVLKKAGNVRWVYGLELQPAQATLLKERVTALTDQRKRQIISQQQYVDALHALGISDNWINGLDAAAEALLTPKLAAFGVPVRTS